MQPFTHYDYCSLYAHASQVSTGWRTAGTVIIIIIGSAFLTFAVFIWRRRRQARQFPDRPAKQQMFMRPYANDPEAHMPLLVAGIDGLPPLPPKNEKAGHARERSMENGANEQWDPRADRVRAPPSRVPVPLLSPLPEPTISEPLSSAYELVPPSADIPVTLSNTPPTPASGGWVPPFGLSQVRFPKIEFNRDGRKSRLPSLHISFQREQSHAVSSPGQVEYRPSTHITPPSSSVSRPSTLNRPFATMSTEPLPEIPRMSPIEITRQSPSTVRSSQASSLMGSMANVPSDVASVGALPFPMSPPSRGESPTSAVSVGAHLFSRKLSTEGASVQTVSRASSAQATSSSGTTRTSSVSGGRPLSEAALIRAASSRSSSFLEQRDGRGAPAPLRRSTTWVPNVLASYSPWHSVVSSQRSPGSTSDVESEHPGAESPPGHLRVAEGYRPMPTLEETPEVTATPITFPVPLPASPRTHVHASPAHMPVPMSPAASSVRVSLPSSSIISVWPALPDSEETASIAPTLPSKPESPRASSPELPLQSYPTPHAAPAPLFDPTTTSAPTFPEPDIGDMPPRSPSL